MLSCVHATRTHPPLPIVPLYFCAHAFLVPRAPMPQIPSPLPHSPRPVRRYSSSLLTCRSRPRVQRRPLSRLGATWSRRATLMRPEWRHVARSGRYFALPLFLLGILEPLEQQRQGHRQGHRQGRPRSLTHPPTHRRARRRRRRVCLVAMRNRIIINVSHDVRGAPLVHGLGFITLFRGPTTRPTQASSQRQHAARVRPLQRTGAALSSAPGPRVRRVLPGTRIMCPAERCVVRVFGRVARKRVGRGRLARR